MEILIDKKKVLDWSEHGIAGFCGGTILYGFAVDSAYDLVDEYEKDCRCRGKDVFRTIVKLHLRDGMLFMADRRDGVLDRNIFSLVPKQAVVWTVDRRRWRITPHLSKYYGNHNSGNMVRHLTVIMERVR